MKDFLFQFLARRRLILCTSKLRWLLQTTEEYGAEIQSISDERGGILPEIDVISSIRTSLKKVCTLTSYTLYLPRYLSYK